MNTDTKVILSIIIFTILIAFFGFKYSMKNSIVKEIAIVKEKLIKDYSPKLIKNDNPKLTIVEFADLACPSCASFDKNLHEFLKDKTDVQYVFRNFPIHKDVDVLSAYLLAANNQDKFFDLKKVVFEKQTEWQFMSSEGKVEKILEYAKTLNIDIEKLKAEQPNMLSKVKEDADDAIAMNINSTPTIVFIFNGETHVKKGGSSLKDLNDLYFNIAK